MSPSRNMPCRELVALVTAYLDGALPAAERARFDEHVRTCAECRTYLAQMELVVSALRELGRSEGEEDRAEKARLVHLFRTWGLHSQGRRERGLGARRRRRLPGTG